MLVREDREAANVKKKKGSMLIGLVAEMGLFSTSLELPDEKTGGGITVTFSPPDGERSTLELPLIPDTAGLQRVDIHLHGSSASVYDMGEKYNSWFSDRFGYKVKLAAVGDQERDILFPGLAPPQQTTTSWLSGVTKSLPVVGNLLGGQQLETRVQFQDCAPFLVCTRRSCQALSEQMPDGAEFDIRRARPNIVVSGQQAWEEDFWGELSFSEGTEQIKIPLKHNCLRCQSLNVDFEKGVYSEERTMQFLKVLQKDRRVDKVRKYNAAFGRYGFITASDVGKELKVGDAVEVSQLNQERSGFGESRVIDNRLDDQLTDNRLAWLVRRRCSASSSYESIAWKYTPI